MDWREESSIATVVIGLIIIFATASDAVRINEGDEKIFEAGSTFTLTCVGDGALNWTYPNHSKERLMLQRQRNKIVLTVYDSWADDTGYYKCFDEWDPYSVDSTYVYVYDKNQLLVSNEKTFLTAVEGKITTIPCRATHPHVKVKLNKFSLLGGVYYKETLHAVRNYNPRFGYYVQKARKDMDGIMMCEAQYNGNEYETSFVFVYEPKSPTFEWPQKDPYYKLPLGERIWLDCMVHNKIGCEIQWFKGGKILNPRLRKSRHNRLRMKSLRYEFRNSEQTLYIERSETNDSGIYECIVKDYTGSITRKFNVTILTTGQSTPSNSSVTAVGITIAIIGIPLIALACLIWRMKKDRKRAHTLTVQDVTAFHEGDLQTVDPDFAIDEQADLLPYKKDFEFPREKLKFGKQLGTGAFGRVVKAEAEGLKEEEEFTTVAVKMVKPHSEISHLKALMTELKLLIYIGHHLNVLNLLGACTTDLIYKELFVILEYCRYGNLHSYLQQHRESFINQVNPLTDVVDFSIGKDATLRPYKEKVSPNPSGETSKDSRVMFDKSSGQLLHSDTAGETSMSKIADRSGSSIPVDLRWNIRYKSDFKGKLAAPLNTKDLLSWSYQVAMGMEYLASLKIVHADLAARNILLADENIVKICDFGLARNLYKNMDYKKTGKDPLPIKWMATEAIVDRVFSTKSDVWSFGVVLWELFSLAKTPYPGIMVNEQFLQQLIEGTRMAKPEYSTREMYRVMLDCWKSNPSDRPDFKDLVHRIGDALDSDIKQNVKAMARNTYVNYSDESNSEYINPEFPERENVKMKKLDDSTLNKLKRISEEDSDNPAIADELSQGWAT